MKDPVLTRLNPKGGLEILSGQRRHMIARELNYPVPAIIQKIDDNDAMILVADSEPAPPAHFYLRPFSDIAEQNDRDEAQGRTEKAR